MMVREPHSSEGAKDAIARADRLRELMNEMIRSTLPQERDRRMQVHLAQARGPVGNATLLRATTAMILRMKAAQVEPESSHG